MNKSFKVGDIVTVKDTTYARMHYAVGFKGKVAEVNDSYVYFKTDEIEPYNENEIIKESEDEHIGMEQQIHELHERIKAMFPDATSVKVFVNGEGIQVDPVFRTDLKQFSMRTITGKWVKREIE